MTLTLLSPPAGEPLTLAEMKTHLRVDHDGEDGLIAGVLAAAVRTVEARGGLALLSQQWRLALDAAPEETLVLPIAPCASIDAVSVIDADGASQAVDPHLYDAATGAPGRVRRTGPWPAPGPRLDGVRIDFTAGYADAASVPAALKQAVMTLAAHFYETREAAREARVYAVPQSVDALIAPYRQVRL